MNALLKRAAVHGRIVAVIGQQLQRLRWHRRVQRTQIGHILATQRVNEHISEQTIEFSAIEACQLLTTLSIRKVKTINESRVRDVIIPDCA